MKKLFAILALCVASTAFAGTVEVDTRGLTASQKAELVKQAEAMKAESGTPVPPAAEKVDAWVRVGTNIGQGLSGAAKEVGVAVNDFAKTPVGQLTMMLIVWHMIGAQLIHLFGGVLIWIVGFTFIRIILKRAYPDNVTYSTTQKNIFGNFAVERVEKVAMGDDNAAGWLFAYGIVLVAGLIAIFTW